MIDRSEILGCVVAFDTRATSDSRIKRTGEVGGDDEGDLLSEWYLDFDLGAIHSQALLLAPNMLKPRKSGRQQGGYSPGPDLG